MGGPQRSWRFWVGAGVCVASTIGLVVVDAVEATLRAEATPTSVSLLLIAAVGFGLVIWAAERGEVQKRWLWAVPICLRIVLMVFTTPTLSDDVYRYLWDGHLVSEGVNPYSFAISAPEGDAYEIDARALANNPDMASPYLPTTQVVFGAAAVLLPSEPWVMQIIMTAFDLLAAWLIARLLALASLPAHRVVLYLWNPLVIVEFAHAAHLDALMVALALLAVWLTLRSEAHDLRAPVVLALATLTRPIPLLLVPVLWWRWNGAQRIAYGATAVLGVVPFGIGSAGFGLFGDLTGTGVFGAARIYSSDFRFNALPSRWLENRVPDSYDALVLVAMALVIAAVMLRARTASSRALLRLMSVPLMAYVLLTPVLHPWYLVLLVAALVFLAPARDESSLRWFDLAPWLYLVAVSPLTYLTYTDPIRFAERDWVRQVEWLPTLALAVVAVAMYAARRANYRGVDGSAVARTPPVSDQES